jgi:hypothetical protein
MEFNPHFYTLNEPAFVSKSYQQLSVKQSQIDSDFETAKHLKKKLMKQLQQLHTQH